MRYKQFGTTDMNVSALTVGTWAIGGAYWGEVNKQDSIQAIHAMLDHGVNRLIQHRDIILESRRESWEKR